MFKGTCPCQKSDEPRSKLAVMCLVEFLGTFFLLQAIVFSVNFAQPLAALAIGSTQMVCIYAWSHVSGGHYNPAISTAAYVSGKLDRTRWILYVITQLIAGLFSGWIAIGLRHDEVAASIPEVKFVSDTGMLTVFLWTFLLASVFMNVGGTSMAPGYRNNSFFGLAVGFTVVSGVIAVGGFSGGAFNPAVATGLNIGKNQIKDPYWPAGNYDFSAGDWINAIMFEFLAGIVAGLVFRITESVEKPADEVDGITDNL